MVYGVYPYHHSQNSCRTAKDGQMPAVNRRLFCKNYTVVRLCPCLVLYIPLNLWNGLYDLGMEWVGVHSTQYYIQPGYYSVMCIMKSCLCSSHAHPTEIWAILGCCKERELSRVAENRPLQTIISSSSHLWPIYSSKWWGTCMVHRVFF